MTTCPSRSIFILILLISFLSDARADVYYNFYGKPKGSEAWEDYSSFEISDKWVKENGGVEKSIRKAVQQGFEEFEYEKVKIRCEVQTIGSGRAVDRVTETIVANATFNLKLENNGSLVPGGSGRDEGKNIPSDAPKKSDEIGKKADLKNVKNIIVQVYKSEGGKWVKQKELLLQTEDIQVAKEYWSKYKTKKGYNAILEGPEELKRKITSPDTNETTKGYNPPDARDSKDDMKNEKVPAPNAGENNSGKKFGYVCWHHGMPLYVPGMTKEAVITYARELKKKNPRDHISVTEHDASNGVHMKKPIGTILDLP